MVPNYRIPWKEFDPDTYVFRVLELLRNQRIAAVGALAFVLIKWFSFFSSVNNLVLQSVPIKWLGAKVAELTTRVLPEIGPLFHHIAQVFSEWRHFWRQLVSPIYYLLSFLKLFHIPEFLLVISTDVIVLIMLPTSAFVVSWITSSKSRAESKVSRDKFDAMIEAMHTRRNERLRRPALAREFAEARELVTPFESLANHLKQEKIAQIRAQTAASLRKVTSIASESENSWLEKLADSNIESVQRGDPFKLIADQSPSFIRSFNLRIKSEGARGLSDEVLHDYFRYLEQSPPPEPFADPKIVAENRRLHQMQLESIHYVYRAVKLSGSLAAVALALMIIQRIWF